MTTTVNVTDERVVLSAVDQFSAVFGKAKQDLGDLRSGVDTVRNALTAVGVTIGAGALIELHRQVLEADAALVDMSESTGASIERLSALRHVAQVGGSDFQGLTGQIGRMIRGLQESTDEGSKAAYALDFVGIKARDSGGRIRDTGQIIEDLAHKLQGYRSDADKAALVQDVLGKGAEKYLPLLKDIAEGTDYYATVTAKQAEEADKAEKAQRRMLAVLEDSRRQLVQEYLPVVTKYVEQLAEGVRLTGSFGNAISRLGTMSPFATPGENVETERQAIEQLLAARKSLAAMPGYENEVKSIDAQLEVARQRKAFAEFLQRQDALSGSGEGNLDARDLQARGGGSTKPLGYKSPNLAEIKRQQLQQDTQDAYMYQLRQERENEYLTKSLDTEMHYGENAQELRERQQKESDAAWVKAIDDANQEALDQAQIYMNSEGNLIEEDYRRRLNALQLARQNEFLTEKEFNDKKEELEIEHQAKINGIWEAGLTDRQRFALMSYSKQTATLIDMLDNMTQTAATHNKTLFEINKIAATANAVIKGWEAVQSAYAFGAEWGGPWGGAAMAAIALAATAANVAAIQATSFGSGASAQGSYAASPASGLPVQAAAPAAPRGPDTFISIRGDDVFTGRTVAKLFEKFNEYTRSGGRLVVSTS